MVAILSLVRAGKPRTVMLLRLPLHRHLLPRRRPAGTLQKGRASAGVVMGNLLLACTVQCQVVQLVTRRQRLAGRPLATCATTWKRTDCDSIKATSRLRGWSRSGLSIAGIAIGWWSAKRGPCIQLVVPRLGLVEPAARLSATRRNPAIQVLSM